MRVPTPEPRLPEAWSGDGWVDVSRPLTRETPVWPGDRIFELGQRSDGDMMVSAFATTCHIGTHVDAPLHLAPGGTAVHEIPFGRLIGPAEVVLAAVLFVALHFWKAPPWLVVLGALALSPLLALVS